MSKTVPNNIPSAHEGTVSNNHHYEAAAKKGGTIISGQENSPADGQLSAGNPVAGFLVSFSKTESGEFWVLREGNNFLGKDHDCTVRLNEVTVSGKHATLNITVNAEENRLDIILIDTASVNGTFLNGKKLLAYNGVVVRDTDKLRIGNYTMKLMIVDRYAENLHKSEVFKEVLDYDYASRDFYTDGTRPMNFNT